MLNKAAHNFELLRPSCRDSGPLALGFAAVVDSATTGKCGVLTALRHFGYRTPT